MRLGFDMRNPSGAGSTLSGPLQDTHMSSGTLIVLLCLAQ